MKPKNLNFIIGNLLRPALVIVMACFILSCAVSAPTRFYTLTPMKTSQDLTRVKSLDSSGLTIGVGPVNFPEYLNRSEIMTQVGPNQYDLSEFHKWAEPLESNFRRVLSENLSFLLKTDNLAVLSWDSLARFDYLIKINVLRFQPTYKDTAVLEAQWTISKKGTQQSLLSCQHVYQEPLKGEGYSAAVSALSRATASLSKDIAESISSHLGKE